MTIRRLWLCAIMATLIAPSFAVARDARSTSTSPVHSIVPDQDQGQPIQIDAATLEVRDKVKQATFLGNVVVVQGDTTLKCQRLVVFYGQGLAPTRSDPANPAGNSTTQVPTSTQNIRKIEAYGGVTVLSKDQKATGDHGVYDLQAKTITLTGNVVVSQGQDVVHGERVVVDTTTGNARVESMNGGGAAPSRVRALIIPTKGENGGSGNIMTIGPGRPN
jgi:lipopolysaccharide export system protein LptA